MGWEMKVVQFMMVVVVVVAVLAMIVSTVLTTSLALKGDLGYEAADVNRNGEINLQDVSIVMSKMSTSTEVSVSPSVQ